MERSRRFHEIDALLRDQQFVSMKMLFRRSAIQPTSLGPIAPRCMMTNPRNTAALPFDKGQKQ
jgi:hypothetical protein